MTYQEYIIENYDNCKLMTSLKFGANSDEMLFILDACTDEGDKKFEKLSKKRKTIAFENIKDLLSNFGQYELEYEIAAIAYEHTHPTYRNLMSDIQELDDSDIWDEVRIDIEHVVLQEDLILHYLEELFDWDIEKLKEFSLITNALEHLQQIKVLEYKVAHMKDVPDQVYYSISHVKDPEWHLKQDNANLKEREEPISVSKSQDRIRDILYNNNIPFEQEYKVLINGHQHRFDFAIYDSKGVKYFIEYDGKQHFKPVEIWGGEEGLKERQQRDKEKNDYCKEKHIPLIRIPYTIDIKEFNLAVLIPKYSHFVI